MVTNGWDACVSNMTWKRLIGSLVLLCSGPGAAQALQLAVPFQARINIETSCAVVADNLDFGNVGTINGGETASATVTVNCSQGTPYTLSFNPLLSITAYNGAMVNGANSVAYSAALNSAGGIGPGAAAILGLLLPQATPAAGIYTDNRTVYLSY